MSRHFTIEVEQEDDGRWIAEVLDLPGVLVYGSTSAEAIKKVQALALRVLAEQLEEQGEAETPLINIAFEAA